MSTDQAPALPGRLTRRGLLRWGTAAAAAAAAAPVLSACTGGASPSSDASGSASGTPSPTAAPAPIPASTTSLQDADQAAGLAWWLAQGAAADGSYGIAGVIVDNATGAVVKAMPNRVLVPLSADAAGGPRPYTQDPTAHGERQLVWWYLENRATLALPPPERLTVVTSLDPCAMCTGALLTAGFNVGVVAPDTFSGIDYTEDSSFADLPEPLRAQARRRFGYYGVEGGRPYRGGADVVFSDSLLTAATFHGCEDTYQASATGVRNARKDTGTEPASLQDPRASADAAMVRQAFRAVSPLAFTLVQRDFRRPDESLRDALDALVRRSPGATEAAAFVDPFGNVLAAATDQFPANAAATALLRVTQDYATVRWALMNDRTTAAVAQATLTSPKYGTVVGLRAPDPRSPTTIEDLGAFASAMEAKPPQPEPSPLQYYLPPSRGTMAELQAVARALPPLYSQLVMVDPQLVGR